MQSPRETQQFCSQVYTPRNDENSCSDTNLYLNIHSSSIHSSRKVDSTQMSIYRRMNKQNAMFAYKGC